MTENYTATIEVDIRDDGTDEPDDAIIDALSEYVLNVGRSPLGYVEIVVTIPATSLTQAAQTITAVIAETLGVMILSIELMTQDEYARRVGVKPIPELVSVTDAAEIAEVSRQAILSRLETGSIAGEKVGNTWVVQKSSVPRLLRLHDANGRELHCFRGVPVPSLVHEGIEYSQTGFSRSRSPEDMSVSYAPTGSGIGLA